MFPSRINIPSYFKVFLSWYSHFFLFYRSNDSSSVTGVTIIIVAILLAFLLVSVLVVCYKRNKCGFKDKAQQCISGMYRWKSLFLKIGIENVFLLKCILVFPFNIPWNDLYLNFLNSILLHYNIVDACSYL